MCRVILKNQGIVIEQSGKYTNQRNHVLENQKFKAFMYIKIWKMMKHRSKYAFKYDKNQRESEAIMC